MFSPDRYVAALRFAAAKHNGVTVKGSDLPYLVHVVSVTAEVIAALPVTRVNDPDLAVVCALLHDTVEDTKTTVEEIAAHFGAGVAAGVSALTKDKTKAGDAMGDSLRRIREQPPEIAIVKLADRITNLAPPPAHWTREKCATYRAEAGTIADALGYASAALEARLRERMLEYQQYC